MVYIGDIEFHSDEIIAPDGYSLQVENICGDDFTETLKQLTHYQLNKENLKELYGDSIDLVYQNMRVVYGQDEIGLSSDSLPRIPGSTTKIVSGITCFVPPEECLVIMDEDFDDDPDTNDFYFIFKR